MLAQEKRIAVDDDHPYAAGVRSGYPHLIEGGRWLAQQGVPFHDLTMMFADTDDVLYHDQCCHLNDKGYDLVVKKMLDIIRTTAP